MCTVTLVPLGAVPGFRIACNRDESRRRPAAEPPRAIAVGGRRALAPRDPQGGGTWIAVNDAGVAMTLLNRNHRHEVDHRVGVKSISGPRAREERGTRRGSAAPAASRGRIIPALLEAATVARAADRARRLDLSPYAPFRLVLADGRMVADLTWDAPGLRVRKRRWRRRPLIFTSSGLGDALVGPPRRALFRRMFARPADPVAIQDRFHRHSWPRRPHLSVCMRRPGARTVSHTVIEIGPARARCLYYPDAPDSGVRPASPVLRLRRAPA